MTVSLEADVIVLSGICDVAEVELLVNHFEKCPNARIDLSATISLHTSLWQVLKVHGRQIEFPPHPETDAGRVFAWLFST